LTELLEPFSEFPLVADSDKAATAAAILSVIGRAAIPGNVPMFSSQAPTPGSGKGLLVELVSVIATGRKPPLMSPTTDDEEVRKRLMAIAIESPTMVVIDNVEHEIGSAPLAMALTAGVVTDRKFGDNTKMITASLRPVWVMTGNNVRLKGDLGRRVVPIDLDAKCEHPEDRKFDRTGLNAASAVVAADGTAGGGAGHVEGDIVYAAAGVGYQRLTAAGDAVADVIAAARVLDAGARHPVETVADRVADRAAIRAAALAGQVVVRTKAGEWIPTPAAVAIGVTGRADRDQRMHPARRQRSGGVDRVQCAFLGGGTVGHERELVVLPGRPGEHELDAKRLAGGRRCERGRDGDARPRDLRL
jgi:hypothetical protein